MFKSLTTNFIFGATLLAFASVSSAQENKLAALLQKAPSPPNVICYINVPALTKLTDDQQVPRLISNRIEELWMVSQLDVENFVPTYEAGYASVPKAATAEQLSQKLEGYVDEIGVSKVVWTPNQMYVVPTKTNAIGFLRPANRALAAKWLDPTVRSEMSNYLFKQSEQPEKFLSFLLAIDLSNHFSPMFASKRLSEFESLKGKDIEPLSKIVASIQGASIIVGRKSLTECIVSFEFSETPNSLTQLTAPILDEILRRNGSAVPEVLSWKATVKDKTISLQGAISDSSLDSLIHVFSLTDQAEHIAKHAEKADSTEQPSGPTAYNTKQYFEHVNTIVEQVRKQSDQDVAMRAKWSDQKARRIDELSILYVDPEMVNYGALVSETLRNTALSIRNRSSNAFVQKAQIGGYYTSGYSSYTNAEYRTGINAQTTGGGGMDFRQALSQIDQMTGDIRRKMTTKYSADF